MTETTENNNLLFIVNPKSGHGQAVAALADIIDIMVRAGFKVRVHTTQKKGDAAEIVKAEGKDYGRIVCSGGDGTLGEVVRGLISAGLEIPVGYIPSGSTNDFAMTLGLPCDDPRLAASIAVNGKPMTCDAAEFCGQVYLYAAAFGLFSATSYATPQPLKNVLGHLAYVLEGSKELRDIPDYTIGDISVIGEYEVVRNLNANTVIENFAEGLNEFREEMKSINKSEQAGFQKAEAVSESMRKASEKILEPKTKTVAIEEGETDVSRNYSLLGKYILGMATNSLSVAGFEGITGRAVDLCDGLLEVTLIKRPENIIEMNQVMAALSNIGLVTNFESPLVRRIKASEITMEFTEPVAFTLDGEYGGEHKKVSIKTLPAAFKIYVEHTE